MTETALYEKEIQTLLKDRVRGDRRRQLSGLEAARLVVSDYLRIEAGQKPLLKKAEKQDIKTWLVGPEAERYNAALDAYTEARPMLQKAETIAWGIMHGTTVLHGLLQAHWMQSGIWKVWNAAMEDKSGPVLRALKSIWEEIEMDNPQVLRKYAVEVGKGKAKNIRRNLESYFSYFDILAELSLYMGVDLIHHHREQLEKHIEDSIDRVNGAIKAAGLTSELPAIRYKDHPLDKRTYALLNMRIAQHLGDDWIGSGVYTEAEKP